MTDKLGKNISIGGLINQTHGQSSECRLWRQVISQAISDAYLDDYRERDSVRSWLGTRDFKTVCDLADLDPWIMERLFYEILSSKSAIARYKGRKLKELVEKY